MAPAKTMTLRASARSPIDFVSAAGSVRVPQNLISELNSSLIDFLMHYKTARAAEGNRGNRGAVDELSEAN